MRALTAHTSASRLAARPAQQQQQRRAVAVARRAGSGSSGGSRAVRVRAEAPEAPVKERKPQPEKKGLLGELSGLGDALGPIGLTYSGGIKVRGVQCSAVCSSGVQ